MDKFLKLCEEHEKSGISDDIFDGLIMKLKDNFEEENNEGALLLLSVIEKVIENSMFKAELISSFKEALDEVLDIEEDEEYLEDFLDEDLADYQ